jgi:enoyl-CoA hydratase/carnithine racemase
MIKSEQVGAVGIVQLNRPKKLNALCKQLVSAHLDRFVLLLNNFD